MSVFTYDLNALPAAVMIYDAEERLQAWNHNVALFYPVITPWLKVGTTLASLAERFIDAVYNVDPGLRQTLRESIVRNCRQDKHSRSAAGRPAADLRPAPAPCGRRHCQPAQRCYGAG